MAGNALSGLLASINTGDTKIIAQVAPSMPQPKRKLAPKPGSKFRTGTEAGAVNLPPKPDPAAAAAAAAGAAGRLGAGGSAAQVVSLRQKKVVDELKRTREELSAEELKTRMPDIDVANDTELQEALARHDNVQVLPDRPSLTYCYRAKTPGIYGREQLLRFLRQQSTVEGSGERGLVGVRWALLDDAYLGVDKDVDALHKEHRIYMFHNTKNAGEKVLFYAEQDPTGADPPLDLSMPQDVVDLFFSTPLPADAADLQAAMETAGLRSMMANRPKLEKVTSDSKSKDRKKRARAINVGKATNAHMPELFAGQGPTEIDVRPH